MPSDLQRQLRIVAIAADGDGWALRGDDRGPPGFILTPNVPATITSDEFIVTSACSTIAGPARPFEAALGPGLALVSPAALTSTLGQEEGVGEFRVARNPGTAHSRSRRGVVRLFASPRVSASAATQFHVLHLGRMDALRRVSQREL
jgi:hypothetical protein